MEQYSPDDTWAIYVYMCGSNLESWDIDEMSDIAKYMVYENAEEIYAENVAKRHENITEFVEEIREKGINPKRTQRFVYDSEGFREAFSKVYKADSNNPPFDIIGYDACLMASVEVADSLNGYGRYLAASEELENGEGWNHTAWLGELAAHPEMNAAQVGKEMVDSYVEYYANQSIQLEWYGVDNMCTFSLVALKQNTERSFPIHQRQGQSISL